MSKAKIKFKDIYKWANGTNPRKIHSELQHMWHVDLPLPNILLSAEHGIAYGGGKIYFDSQMTSNVVGIDLENKVFSSIETALGAYFAEEDAHYIADNLVPENALRPHNNFDESLQNHDARMFLESFNLGAQFEAIGKLGKRRIMSLYDSSYTSAKEIELNEIYHGTNRGLMNVLKHFRNGQNASGDEITNWSRHLYGIITSSSGQHVADVFQQTFDGKMPELIRKRLEPDPVFNPFVKKYYDLVSGSREFFSYLGMIV